MGQPSLFQLFANRRMAALAAIGFASGLPNALAGDAMTGWLTSAGVDVKKIGLAAIVSWPYTLKFLWAPLMDRYNPAALLGPLGRKLDRRRAWLLLTQLLLVLSTLAVAVMGPQRLLLFEILISVVVFCSASQDIVADAYRTDVLSPTELGIGAAIFVIGYRLAMLASGGASFILAESIGWSAIYALIALLFLPLMLLTLLAPPPPAVAQPAGEHDSWAWVVEPFTEFFRGRLLYACLVVAFILVFKIPDSVAGVQTIPYLTRELSYSLTSIGTIRQGLGMLLGILGGLTGGVLISRLDVYRSLWVAGVLQAVSNVGYLLLGFAGGSLGAMAGVIGVEAFCGGMVGTVFVAFLMSQCDHRYSAVHFSLLSCFMALGAIWAKMPTGYVVKLVGWSNFFLISIAVAIPGLALLPGLARGIAAAQKKAQMLEPNALERETPESTSAAAVGSGR